MVVSYISGLVLLIPTLIAVIYGFAVVLPKHKILYCSMGTMALLCLLLGELADVALIFTGHDEALGFRTGTLGAVGCSLFFLTANLSSVNLLPYKNRPEFKKYDWLANIGPVLNVLLYAFCIIAMQKQNNYIGLVSGCILTVVTMLPVYFSTKFAMLPDTEGGFITCMRPYHISVTALELLFTVERGIHNFTFEKLDAAGILIIILYALMGLSTLTTVAFLKKGVEKWKTI